MKNIFKTIKNILGTKKSLGVLLLTIISIFLPIKGVFAGENWFANTYGKAASSVFGWAANTATMWITEQIIKFFGFLIQLEAKLLAFVVDLSHFTTLEVVQTGWKICRDFANLFFIAVLIYIAFSLILKLQKGDPKKLLFKVIAMAIIINFSLMIGGIIIDFSQVLFRYFIFSPLEQKDGVGFGKQLAEQFRLSKFLSTDYNPTTGVAAITKISDNFLKMIFIIIFFALVSIVFGAIAVTLFVRNFWLWILLILSPLAWFLGMVPIGVLSKYANLWWTNFLKWCFMAPIMGFFVFLSFTILKNSGTGEKIIDEEKLKNQWESSETQKGSQEQIFSFQKTENTIFNPVNVLYLITTIAFLVAGLMAGQSLGSGAAKGAMGMINKAQKGTQKWLGKRVANNPVTRGATNLGAKSLNALTTMPVIGRAFKGAAVKATAKRDELRSEKGQLGKKFNAEQLGEMWKSGNLNEQEKVEAAKKIGYDKLNQKQFEEMQNIYSRKGMGYDKEKKDLEKAAPHFMKGFAEEARGFENSRQEFSKVNAGYEKIDNEYKEAVKNRDNDETAYKKAEEEYKKSEDSAKVLEGAGSTEEAKKVLDEAKKKVDDANNKFEASKVNVSTLGTQRDDIQKIKETARDKFEQARAPIMERFQETDLSKLSGLSESLKDLKTAQAQALIDVMAHKPMKNINSALSKIRGKNMAATFALRQGVTTSMAENLYLDGGVGAVVKMSQLDSSPGARAGHYDFAETVKRMKINGEDITEEMKKNIIEAAHKKKQTEKIISNLAEEIEKTGNVKTEEKKEEKTENKKEDKKE